MATMLNIYDRLTRKKTAVLQNAYNIIETHDLNNIYTLSFTLPTEDEKTEYCQPRHYVRWGEDGELYRIKTPKRTDSATGVITYECEHVITTLCDDVMFGTKKYGGAGAKTRQTITWLLNQQKTKNWVLDKCAFDRQFEYLWEQENILNALYSIPKEFAAAYKWSFDTTVYPWKLSLLAIDATIKPEYYLRAKSNILSSGTSADYANICTRLYPLGYGEGVNQLNIKDANNGVPYIQSPKAITDKYGIVEKVMVDRRFENAESLKAYAQSMLDLYQEPSMSRSFSVVDLYPLTSQSWDDAEVGKICRMVQDGSTAYITKTKWQRDKAGDLQIELSTKATDIAQNVADLADRIRIESVYAQGATQLYQHSKDANATPEKGMVLNLYFPSEMRQINKVLLKMELKKFRSYSKTTTKNGGFAETYQTSDVPNQQITTQKNTESEKITLTYNAQTITTQTNTSSEKITLSYKAQTITTQTNTASEKVDIKWGDATYTAGMTAGEGQDIETTRDGGGTGTTSVDSSTVDISGSSDAVWSGDGELFQSDDGRNQDTDDGVRYYYEDGNGYTDKPFTDDYDNHTHTYYKPYHHYHNVSLWVTFAKWKFAHSHEFSLSGVGGHSHTFQIGGHTHNIDIGHTHQFTIPGRTISVPCPKHTHTFTIPQKDISVPCPKHTHTFTIPKKDISISCPKHTHTFTIPGHKHEISIPDHDHNIIAGIFESTETPTGFYVYVNGKKLTSIQTVVNGTTIRSNAEGLLSSTAYDGDITTWLLNNYNRIPRDSWLTVEIRPNTLAYVVSSVFIQGFVQSRGDGTY